MLVVESRSAEMTFRSLSRRGRCNKADGRYLLATTHEGTQMFPQWLKNKHCILDIIKSTEILLLAIIHVVTDNCCRL